ncbi:arsenate reductase (glutaredoxin) [Aquabacterium sp.]|uniref:arsenate reductase (glutaredoxin) n=1 Tax=Aquabacterium sp. TaxID=1872578 RepID=UPI003D6CBA5F
MNSITIFHNPACGTSRSTLALLRERGFEPQVIEYLKTPPSREALQGLLDELAIPARELLRGKEALYSELGLDDAKWSDAELLDILAAHPALFNRPVVVTPKGARVCRPAERVLEILPEA